MLKVDDLRSQLKAAISNIVVPAIEQVLLSQMPVKSNLGEEKAKQAAETFDELVSDELATIFAQAIDYYIKSASITGSFETFGSPTHHHGQIISMPTPMLNGKTPNTLGIS